MNESELYKLRYPIGEFQRPEKIDAQSITKRIKTIELLPQKLRESVKDLTKDQLDTPYRPAGWTVRQVIHHLPDSHMNSYTRFKLALTEEAPTIKPYFEDRWALLEDYNLTPVDVSLNLLESLHQRWVILLRSLNTEQLHRTFLHPEYNSPLLLHENITLYAWHGDHHLAHIESLKQRMKW